jgi:2-furoyl-CoA dehydrogenase FAD binding subunit
MKPAPFDYLRAETVGAALETLKQTGAEARVLAGGQSLVAMLNLRLVRPQLLVDISRLASLAYIRADGTHLEVGATTTQAALQRWPDLAAKAPLLHQALPCIGHYQTRNRGTVCGSLAHADPSSELPLCLSALGGEVVLRSARGRRVLPAAEFQSGMLTTARRPDEMIVAARFPLARDGARYAFREMSRGHGDFAIVALAAVVTSERIRLSVGGVADRPVVREWAPLSGSDLDDALNAFAWELGGHDDIHASARYRRDLVRRLGRRVVEETMTRCA